MWWFETGDIQEREYRARGRLNVRLLFAINFLMRENKCQIMSENFGKYHSLIWFVSHEHRI